MRLLIALSDHATSQSVELYARNHDIHCYSTDLGEEAVDLAKIYDYEMIVLGLKLDDISGFEVVRQIRAAKVKTPIIILAQEAEVPNRVKAFGLGADDFVPIPFHVDELIARIHAIVRRVKGHASPTIVAGAITLDLQSKIASVDGNRLHLTGKEYSILELLALRKGTMVSKSAFLNHLYGGMDEPEIKIVDVFICKLRKKIKDACGQQYIETLWGNGYRLVETPITKRTLLKASAL